MKKRTIIALVFVITICFYSPAMALDDIRVPESNDLRAWMTHLTRSEAQPSKDVSEDANAAVLRFYQRVGYRPVWACPEGLLPDGELLLQTITKASAAGLNLGDYWLPDPETAWVGITHGTDDRFLATMSSYIQLDIVLTERILRYASHVYQGRVIPEKIYPAWRAVKRTTPRDIPDELAQAVMDDRFESFIESLHPRSEAYQRLRKALRQYKRIRGCGGWLSIDAGPTLRQGERGPRVAMLKYRLKITGDGFHDGPIVDDLFDEAVVSAVKHFQHRHGLTEDGIVGKTTLAELNVPVEKRIHQLQLSMERWRWFPDSFGDRYLMVNIPAFELTIVDSGEPIDRIRVIVGKKERQTPILSDRMTYVEFNPYWNIPQKIARRDILPKVKHDPTYLIRQGIRVFDSWDRSAQEVDPTTIDWGNVSARYFPYRLRQDPSQRNALGQIKFIFPNPLSIYIHDTPGKSLFNCQERAFSSGCVRLEEPITLATHLLSDQGWNRNRLEALTTREKPQSVVLTTPMPVHLVYFTAWVDGDQTVNFRKDIYGHDARLFQALQHLAPNLFVCNDIIFTTNLLSAVQPNHQESTRCSNDVSS